MSENKCASFCWDTELGHHTLMVERLEPNGDTASYEATAADLLAAGALGSIYRDLLKDAEVLASALSHFDGCMGDRFQAAFDRVQALAAAAEASQPSPP